MTYIQPHMTRALTEHVLHQLVATDIISVWMMKRPKRRTFCVQITFTPEGITIQGDIGLGTYGHGLCSSLGYDAGWFNGATSEEYLCGKFMRQNVWQAEVAAKGLMAWVHDPDHKENRRDLLEIVRTLQTGEMDEHAYYEACSSVVDDMSDLPGLEFDLADAGWLCAIQTRFRELYDQREATSK